MVFKSWNYTSAFFLPCLPRGAAVAVTSWDGNGSGFVPLLQAPSTAHPSPLHGHSPGSLAELCAPNQVCEMSLHFLSEVLDERRERTGCLSQLWSALSLAEVLCLPQHHFPPLQLPQGPLGGIGPCSPGRAVLGARKSFPVRNGACAVLGGAASKSHTWPGCHSPCGRPVPQQPRA